MSGARAKRVHWVKLTTPTATCKLSLSLLPLPTFASPIRAERQTDREIGKEGERRDCVCVCVCVK